MFSITLYRKALFHRKVQKNQKNIVFVLPMEPYLFCLVAIREYLMYNRIPGFLAVVWFGSFPLPSPLPSRQQVVSLSQSSCVSTVELLTKEWRGARSQIIRRRESLVLYKSTFWLQWLECDTGCHPTHSIVEWLWLPTQCLCVPLSPPHSLSLSIAREWCN